MSKLRFASTPWFAAAEAAVRRIVAKEAKALAGQHVVVSETFTDVPEGGDIAWHFAVDDGAVSIGRTARADADLRITADYEGLLPLARTVYSDAPGVMEGVEAKRAELLASGRLRIDGQREALPPAVGLLLRRLHNELAAITA